MKRKRTRTPNEELPTDFVAFWSAYPRKVAKPKALKSWLRIAPDASLVATILAAVERHKSVEQWHREGGKFIPHPATWLNDKRWEDEPPLFASNGHASTPRVFADQLRDQEAAREVVPMAEVARIIRESRGKDGGS